MGLEGAIKLGYKKELEAIDDLKMREQRYHELVAIAYEKGKAINAAETLEFDEVIDPVDTRKRILSTLGCLPPKITATLYRWLVATKKNPHESYCMRTIWPPFFSPFERLTSTRTGDKEVVIAVKACSLNFPDTLIIQGKYQYKPELPFTPGSDIAGIVKSVGGKVKNKGW